MDSKPFISILYQTDTRPCIKLYASKFIGLIGFCTFSQKQNFINVAAPSSSLPSEAFLVQRSCFNTTARSKIYLDHLTSQNYACFKPVSSRFKMVEAWCHSRYIQMYESSMKKNRTGRTEKNLWKSTSL